MTVATGAMEMRGGNGFIEDWSNAKLVRDAHLGVLWEGTSSVNAIDIVRRAVGKERSHLALAKDLHTRLENAAIPGQFRGELNVLVDRAVKFVDDVAADASAEIVLSEGGLELIPCDECGAYGQRRRAAWRCRQGRTPIAAVAPRD